MLPSDYVLASIFPICKRTLEHRWHNSSVFAVFLRHRSHFVPLATVRATVKSRSRCFPWMTWSLSPWMISTDCDCFKVVTAVCSISHRGESMAVSVCWRFWGVWKMKFNKLCCSVWHSSLYFIGTVQIVLNHSHTLTLLISSI